MNQSFGHKVLYVDNKWCLYTFNFIFWLQGTGTVAITAFCLGLVCATGVAVAFYTGGTFGVYIALLAFFHQMEYLCVAASRPELLSFDCEQHAIQFLQVFLNTHACSFCNQSQHSIHNSCNYVMDRICSGVVVVSIFDWLVRCANQARWFEHVLTFCLAFFTGELLLR